MLLSNLILNSIYQPFQLLRLYVGYTSSFTFPACTALILPRSFIHFRDPSFSLSLFLPALASLCHFFFSLLVVILAFFMHFRAFSFCSLSFSFGDFPRIFSDTLCPLYHNPDLFRNSGHLFFFFFFMSHSPFTSILATHFLSP